MRRARWGALLLLLVVTGVLALMLGATNIAPADIWGALVGDGRDTATVAIVRAVRLPRVLLAMLVGAALGMSGSVLQGTLRNALAEPYLLGVSGGAAVGAVEDRDGRCCRGDRALEPIGRHHDRGETRGVTRRLRPHREERDAQGRADMHDGASEERKQRSARGGTADTREPRGLARDTRRTHEGHGDRHGER